MSKYNLEEIHNNNLKEAMSADDQARFDQLTKDDQLKLEKIYAMMRAEKDAIEKDARKAKGMMEDFDSVVDKIKDSGKSEEDAKKIAGAINAKYVGNYREGVEENGTVNDYTEEIAEENDEDKLPMDEGHSEGDEMKMHLKQYRDGNIDGDDLANAFEEILMGKVSPPSERGFNTKYGMEENHAMQGVEAELESGEIGNMDALTEDSVKDLLDKIASHLKGSDRNFQDGEIEMYIDSLKRDIKRGEFDGVESLSMEDHELDLEEYIRDKMDDVREHFGRFLKDYQ